MENDLNSLYTILTGRKVLCVDDNDLNQLVITKILTNAGIEIVQALNGAIAIQKLKDGLRPDVILMDLEMPVMNGEDAIEIIRQEIDSELPIIINSGFVDMHQKIKLRSLGISDFLEKPYSQHDILKKLLKNMAVTH